ncbi:MAG: DUF4917 family protein [Sphaerochaetaceae bacterium]|jgi:hypothetical protein
MGNKIFLSYQEVLEKIEGQENHLLIANGFNRGLGVNTGYKAIFQKMVENHHSVYNDSIKMIEECDYDLELFIKILQSDIKPKNKFLRKYINNKIKLDFMQATHEIVKSEIKKVYAKNNEGIYLLFKQLTNFFTLNYDSFLYLLLLKYKPIKNESMNSIAFEPNLKFIAKELDERHSDIYCEIKTARDNGKLRISFGNEREMLEKDFNKLNKNHFLTEVKEYSKSNGKEWKHKDIKMVVNRIIDEENEERGEGILDRIDDGSRQCSLFGTKNDFIFENTESQNLFFLHGAFHIYKDGNRIKKITQQSDKALYDRLEEVLNTEEKEVVCVFQPENKIDVIKNNKYLKRCLQKLSQITGNLVIVGSSLAENDNHIFKQISESKIDTIYISTLKEHKAKMLETAKASFPTKEIYLFEAETISYEMSTGTQ